VLAGLATQGWLLIAGRFVQGLGGGAFVPGSLALLTATFTGHRARSRALAGYGAMAGLGFVAGMVGGGVITNAWGWRWIFLLNLPVVAVMLVATRPALAESRSERSDEPLDIVGSVTATAGLILLILAITTVPLAGWSDPAVWIPGLLGATALASFVLSHRALLVGSARVVAPNGAVALQSMVGVGWLYLLTLYFQEVRGFDALRSGLLFAPMTVASLAGAAVAGRAALRFGPRVSSTAGLVLVAAGVIAMAAAMFHEGGLALLIAGMVVGEAGSMLTSVALTIVATASLNRAHSGLASGLLNTATQLGGGIGLAFVATVVAAARPSPALSAEALGAGFIACLVVVAAALLVVTAGLRLPR
jgi:MFS family permease